MRRSLARRPSRGPLDISVRDLAILTGFSKSAMHRARQGLVSSAARSRRALQRMSSRPAQSLLQQQSDWMLQAFYHNSNPPYGWRLGFVRRRAKAGISSQVFIGFEPAMPFASPEEWSSNVFWKLAMATPVKLRNKRAARAIMSRRRELHVTCFVMPGTWEGHDPAVTAEGRVVAAPRGLRRLLKLLPHAGYFSSFEEAFRVFENIAKGGS